MISSDLDQAPSLSYSTAFNTDQLLTQTQRFVQANATSPMLCFMEEKDAALIKVIEEVCKSLKI